MRDLLQRVRQGMATREFHVFMLFCLPALLAGLILRVVLTVQMPYGVFHDDTPDFLDTANKLIHEGRFRIHSKKTFVTPVLYMIPALVSLPVLIVVPLMQHVMGLLTILGVAALCRLWFRFWKWAIVPVTMLVALDPAILWFEKVLMAESHYLLAAVGLAVVGTWYARSGSKRAFVLLCVALFLMAGARPEGKLFLAFGFTLVVLAGWGAWRMTLRRVGVLVLLTVVTMLLTRTSQSGLLLFTSVFHLAPNEPKSAPGFAPYLAELKEEFNRPSQDRPFAKVRERRMVSAAVDRYFAVYPRMGKVGSTPHINSLCKKLAFETCLRSMHKLPALAGYKFLSSASEPVSGEFDERWLQERQVDSLLGEMRLVRGLSPRLAGEPLETEEQVGTFVSKNYNPVRVTWLDRYNQAWAAAWVKVHLPDVTYRGFTLAGAPVIYLLALVGMLAAIARWDRLRTFHLSWGVMLLGLWFVIILTANVKARFRFVFEPFWFLYAAMLVETCVLAIRRPFLRKPGEMKPG